MGEFAKPLTNNELDVLRNQAADAGKERNT
jgi:hypothetical protein